MPTHKWLGAIKLDHASGGGGSEVVWVVDTGKTYTPEVVGEL